MSTRKRDILYVKLQIKIVFQTKMALKKFMPKILDFKLIALVKKYMDTQTERYSNVLGNYSHLTEKICLFYEQFLSSLNNFNI